MGDPELWRGIEGPGGDDQQRRPADPPDQGRFRQLRDRLAALRGDSNNDEIPSGDRPNCRVHAPHPFMSRTSIFRRLRRASLIARQTRSLSPTTATRLPFPDSAWSRFGASISSNGLLSVPHYLAACQKRRQAVPKARNTNRRRLHDLCRNLSRRAFRRGPDDAEGCSRPNPSGSLGPDYSAGLKR